MGYSITEYLLENVPKDFWQKEHFINAWGEWAKPIPNWEGETFQVKPEATNKEHFTMFNTGGVETEVGEFLYALTRLVRPKRVLETGTHFGISDLYFALALEANCLGDLTTIEFNPPFYLMAQALFETVGVSHRIELIRDRAERYDPGDTQFEILFLDTEPSMRFDELVRFYPNVAPGGFIIIHDLHPHLGLTVKNLADTQDVGFGDFRKKFGDLLEEHSLQTISLPAPRGLTIFQKIGSGFGANHYLRGEI